MVFLKCMSKPAVFFILFSPSDNIHYLADLFPFVFHRELNRLNIGFLFLFQRNYFFPIDEGLTLWRFLGCHCLASCTVIKLWSRGSNSKYFLSYSPTKGGNRSPLPVLCSVSLFTAFVLEQKQSDCRQVSSMVQDVGEYTDFDDYPFYRHGHQSTKTQWR